MLKKIIILILVVAMLSLASCKVVDVIDHGTTVPEETTTPQKEYAPWGFWHSYDSAIAVELIETGNAIKLFSLTTGYYEYFDVIETTYTRENDVFTVSWNESTYVFTFDKFSNTLKMSTPTNAESKVIDFTFVEKAPQEHPKYDIPNFAELASSSYITVGDIDFDPIAKLVFEGAPYNIAMTYYEDMKNFPKAEGLSRPAKSGDAVNIDYKGTLDGVAFGGGTAQNVTLFISDYQNGYIPGFTDGIIGHSVGETFDVPVTFPEEYHAPDLAGKAVIFTMTLNYICDMTLTDEKVEKYESNAHKTYGEWLKEEQLSITKTEVASALLKATTTNTPIPSEVYLYYYQQAMDYYHMIAYYYNFDFSTLMSIYGLSEMAIMRQALNQATYNITLFSLMKEKELSWTDEEYSEKYDALVAEFLENNKDATNEDAVAYADGLKNQIELDLAEEKVLIWSFGMIFPSDSE